MSAAAAASSSSSIPEQSKKEYTFFWKTHSCFSQWHKSPFTIDGLSYCMAEQFMMAEKARLFKDHETEKKIMASKNARVIKELGWEVKNFDEATWVAHRYLVVRKGNLAKFSQNASMRAELLNTGATIIVEASPSDKIWGIGLTEEKAATIPEQDWPGLNLLGIALMEVRKKLNPDAAPVECKECKAVIANPSDAIDACYDCGEDDWFHEFACSDACKQRSLCRTGSCDHWSMYDCKEFLGIPDSASAEEIAADRAEKYARKAEYEASKQ